MLFAISPLAAFLMATATAETPPPGLCETGEQTIIGGTVQDEFGLDVAVCVTDDAKGEGANKAASPRLTIRWSGEGGGDALSCLPTECEGVIEYSRYTSRHLTILQLAWTKDGHVQRLYQTLSRPSLQETAASATSHEWEVAGACGFDIEEYPMQTDATPLALMKLERIIAPKPSNTGLLQGARECGPER
ncbi:MAG: hypothetical protein QNJ15_03755 [Erythrobacter sp.]|nr:hypothetical protein [Erythrobacter sp.]